MSNTEFSQKLLTWFDLHGRKDLPWQVPGIPYHVWLSEIMLQQTQVTTVIPYFLRFIERFPDINQLANAETEEVLSFWAGLGYYARGRNLHRAAKIMQSEHHADIPADFDTLCSLPGIGRSTAGAIMALAFEQRYPILDGNVKRVLARFDAVEAWPGEKQTEQQLWLRAEALLPRQRLKNYIQAQMDLGAMVCTRHKPKCDQCPMTEDCRAYQLDLVSKYPITKKRAPIPQRKIFWLVLQDENTLYMMQRPEKGIWGGLWSFPEFASSETLLASEPNQTAYTELPAIQHVFTHFKLEIVPIHILLSKQNSHTPNNKKENRWVKIDGSDMLPLPAPVKAFIKTLQK